MNCKVEIDIATLRQKIERDKKAATMAVGEQIIADCDQYVPCRDGDLKASGITNGPQVQSDGSVNLIWDKVYAAYQWYGCWPDGSHVIQNHDIKDGSSKATIMWVDEAKKQYGKDWEKVGKNAVKKNY